MLGKKISFKKLGKKVKLVMAEESQNESLLKEMEEATPTGSLALYIGEEHRRFLVPTQYLSHPLFKMLLDKAYDEFGFQQASGLVVPCSVSTFRKVVSAVDRCHGRFQFGNLVEEFV